MIKSHHHDNPTLLNATIAEDGRLKPRHENLYKHLGGTSEVKIDVEKRSGGKKNVLLLGSGFVAKPLVDYLLKGGETKVTIGEYESSDGT